jgi:tetratricopeptide (TPR) repeat protein
MGTHYCVNRVPSASPCSSLHQLPDLSSLNSLLDLGNSFYEQRQFQKALKCYYQALEGFRVLFNKDNPAIALTLNNIALVYKN